MATKSKAANVDSKGQDLYLRVIEEREHGYFHLRARFCVQKFEDHQWVPYGVDDDYSDGLKWSGLRVSCQGDDKTQLRAGEGESGAVYGFDVEYHDVWRLDLRQLRRMTKTLERADKGLSKLREARGYVRSYGEYLGRVAEVFGCKGVCFEQDKRNGDVSGQRYVWLSVGDAVNRANHRIFLWQQEAVERGGQLQAAG